LSPEVSGWVPEPLRQVKASVPIACVDIIVYSPIGAILLGWRVIHPYVNVWVLLGGRIRIGENVAKTVRRVLSTHRIGANGFYIVGVYPMKFLSRFDNRICLATQFFWSSSPLLVQLGCPELR